ncbi:MAG: hypothetical protein OER04_06200 [Cyclobacteriaceae bacterium]|nr:hypothetical protein [Cyclobacteriaceae bacterium]
MKWLFSLIIGSLLSCSPAEQHAVINIELSSELADSAQNGRLILLIATDSTTEPRFQLSDGVATAQAFGLDVEDWAPGSKVQFNEDVWGYPLKSLKALEAGIYYIQGVFNRYERFDLSTGHTVYLPPEKGEGQQWNRKPGNFYTTPQRVVVDEGNIHHTLKLTEVIPDIEPPADTEYIKHVRIKSALLSEFWGRDVYLGAHVLVPEGFDEHPEARFPLMVFHGHFPYDFGGFRIEPPDENLEPEYSDRFDVPGYNRMVQQEAHDFYKQWTSADFPRMLIIKIQHANPYYDDSYAVNSANLGPYGDAITFELIPYIEQQFRGIGAPWSRFLYGGSTGGWEALAAQVMYPDQYNGCFAACPDPIDFRAYCLVDIYNHENAYYSNGPFRSTLRPGHRDYLGHVDATLKDMNHRELILGTKSRSGQQWDIWEAVYSPQGEDGYPQRLWDKRTGEIDHQVAEYWKQNYDLRYILERDWETLGPLLKGKIHVYCGDMDNYYLNNAVYLMEQFLESTQNPYYQGEVAYGDRAEHCWNGDPDNPNHVSRLRYNTMYIPKILKRMQETAPAGADLSSWRY